jgi:serine/threonine-protein kinase
MLVGTAPFMGPITELIEKHLYEAPMPLSQMMSHPLPSDLEEILMRMLSKRPQDRYDNLGQVVAGLRQCQGQLVD